jgi:hypothetical protein
MIRYRSARTVPGENPPPGDESEEIRPTGVDAAAAFPRAASISDGVARPVGICETELTGDPQEEQKRASSGTSEEQDAHRRRSISAGRISPSPRRARCLRGL